MNIILDTNIIEKNFSLTGIQFEALNRYLEMTGKYLKLVYVVKKEIISNYRKQLKKAINDLQTTAKDFHNIAITEEYQKISKGIKELAGRTYFRKNQTCRAVAFYTGFFGLSAKSLLKGQDNKDRCIST